MREVFIRTSGDQLLGFGQNSEGKAETKIAPNPKNQAEDSEDKADERV